MRVKKENNIYITPERSEGCIKENKMISKEKQILLESFNRRSLKRSNTQKLMDRMFQGKQKQIRKFREEEYDNKVSEWKKQGSIDFEKLGHNQKSISPTSRSTVRPFNPQRLQEQRMLEWEKELEEIQEWLDN